jgi:hypothetical protein
MTTNETKSGALYVRNAIGAIITDTSNNGVQILQQSATTHTLAPLGSVTTFRCTPILELSNSVTVLSDATSNLGTETLRLAQVSCTTEAVKTHAAFTGSAAFTRSGAIQTTTATATTIATLAVADNAGIWIEVNATGRDTASATRAWIERIALYQRQAAGAPVAVGTTAGTSILGGAWGAVSFLVSGNNVLVQVTGAAATTINWAATIRSQTTSGNT